MNSCGFAARAAAATGRDEAAAVHGVKSAPEQPAVPLAGRAGVELLGHPAPACTSTIGDTIKGSITVKSGVTCLTATASVSGDVNADGSLGRRNDVKCVSIEHKLGIHASPTAVMAYGEKEGAAGYIVGEPHRGLDVLSALRHDHRRGGQARVAVPGRARLVVPGVARPERGRAQPGGHRGTPG